MAHQKLLNLFENYHIEYDLHAHEALFTVDDAMRVQSNLEGAHSKNLFLRDKDKNYFLVSVLSTKHVHLKSLSKSFGKGHFSFASPDDLKEKLGVTPGAVSPYGLINDKAHEVTFLLDRDMMKYDFVNFHPLRNDMTVKVPLQHFLNFFDKIGHNLHIIDIPIHDGNSAH